MAIYSGGAQVEAFFGKQLKIGFCRKDHLPNSGYYNIWCGGSITNWNRSGGAKSTEGVKAMGGVTKQYQKPQEDFELTFNVLPTDTFFDEMQMGEDGFYVDMFDSYADNAAVQTAWTEAGDAANPTLDSTNYKSGRQGMLMTWTDSTHATTYTLDLSTTHGQTYSITGFTGATGTPTRGRIEMIVYVPTATDLANVTTISVQLGDSSSSYAQYDYTVSGNMIVGWNKVIYDMSTEDATAGTRTWSAVDHFQIKLTTSGDSSSGITVDRVRVFDPIIASDNVPGLWRATLLYETNSSAAVGEKNRAYLFNCKVTEWAPESDAEDYLKGALTLSFPATDASGNPNIKMEHTPDASEAALSTPDSY